MVLSVEEGIKIQTRQLEDWRTKLNHETYFALFVYATSKNNQAKDGFDICRGNSLDVFIKNFKPKNI
jgi:hypothetical protein